MNIKPYYYSMIIRFLHTNNKGLIQDSIQKNITYITIVTH